MSDKAAKHIEEVILDEGLDIDETVKKVESIDNQIKFGAFGKTRCNKGKHKSIVKEDATDEDLLKSQSKKIEEEIIKLKSQKLGRVGSVFKMKEVINGPKKPSQEPTAIRDPNTGDLIVSNEEIRKVTLAYCADNLSRKSQGRMAQLRNDLNKMRMTDSGDDEEFRILKSDFEGVLKKFESKSTKSYDFILKAGKKYKDVMYKLCKKMVENVEFPKSFRKTLLYMIWKQKGPAEVLKNSRFIHMKESFLPRTCEALVVTKMKEIILKSSSKYQVGGQPGHGPEEHIFTIKSIWAMLEMLGKGMIITLVDIIAFFDREDIGDVMETLHRIGVNKKAARVWFKLNEGTEIAVKTATGVSDSVVVGDCIGQGTAGAALVSQANLDLGLMDYFKDSDAELEYGGVRLQPLAYQDDVLRGSKDVMDTNIGNIKLAAMLDEKGLQAHPDKTCYIVTGSKKYKEKVNTDLERSKIMLGDFPVKQKECDRCLGQMLHREGLDRSAEATAQERVGRLKGATREIKGIIEEFQMQTLGGMMDAGSCGKEPSSPVSSVGLGHGLVGGTARKLLRYVMAFKITSGE